MASKGLGADCLMNFPVTSAGIWVAGSPFRASLPLTMIQILTVIAISRLLQSLLRPFNQPVIICQIMSGVLLGPTLLGRLPFFSKTVYPASRMTPYNTFSMISMCMHMFMVGVKTDLGMLRRVGKKALAIGLISNVTTYLVSGMVRYYLPVPVPKALKKGYGLAFILPLHMSLSYFVVITTLLKELRLLNSKVGRLAVSSALVSDISGLVITRLIKSVYIGINTGSVRGLGSFLSLCGIVAAGLFVARPIVLWIIDRTPKGQLLDETYFIAIIVLCFSFGLLSELAGHTTEIGMLLLGLMLPSGPPVGSTITEKLEGIFTYIGLPIFCAMVGLNSNLFLINQDKQTAAYLWTLIFLSYTTKFCTVMFLALFCNWSLNHASILALIMSAKGIFDLRCFNLYLQTKTAASIQIYSVMTSFFILQGVVTSPLIKTLYKPWDMYRTDKRRTVQHGVQNTELRTLVCVHRQENVAPIIDLLGAIHRQDREAMCVYVLHMIHNTGQVAPVLVPYKPRKTASFKSMRSDSSDYDSPTNSSEPIMNTFSFFEHQNPRYLSVQPFVSIAPWDTMHDDVCYLALDKKVALVVLPFHRSKVMDVSVGYVNAVRAMNINVLAYAPCSVGILINHKLDTTAAMTLSQVQHSVAVYFFGGPDDREALSIASRMIENPRIQLTVVRLLFPDDWCRNNPADNELDRAVIEDFCTNCVSGFRVVYREERVTEVEEMVDKIRSMSEEFSLIIIGRREGGETIMNDGLAVWSEHPELGVIGDILASTDFSAKVSTLVVQQQKLLSGCA